MSYLRALKFNQCSIRHHYLRTQKQKLPLLTLAPESIQKEKEKRREVFWEIYNNIPAMREPVSALRITLKALAQSMSWVFRDMKDRNLDE